jgi:hypothetical protein
MSTATAAHVQQKWEYLELTRKTETYLVNELNQLGEEGWELVSVTYRKDPKAASEAWSWTVFLKRPYTGIALKKSGETSKLKGDTAATRRIEAVASDDGAEDIFDVKE